MINYSDTLSVFSSTHHNTIGHCMLGLIIIIIITTTIFIVLSSWQSHCESSLGSRDEYRNYFGLLFQMTACWLSPIAIVSRWHEHGKPQSVSSYKVLSK